MKRTLLGASGLMLLLAWWLMPVGQTQNDKPTPRPYGLVGDGIADDTNALEAALQAGSVRLPRGVYKLTRTIKIELDKSGFVGLQGDGTAQLKMTASGPALHFIGTHAGTAAPKSVLPAVWDRQRTPMIDGIEIVGSHPEADGLAAEGTLQLTITRSVIRQCRHGVHLQKRNRNVLISACHIYQNRGIGVYLDHVNLHQINIDGCHISYCEMGGVVSKGGEVRNLQIGTCDIESCMSEANPPTANVLLDCTGGSIAEVAITGCTIQHNNLGRDSANIRVLGLGKGIKPDTQAKWGHITISGNVLSDVQHNIDLDSARGVSITGNTFWMAYQYNIRARNCEQLVLSGNILERNPAYDYGTSKTTLNAVLFEKCKDCTLNSLQLHEVRKEAGAALKLIDCERFNISGCTIIDSHCPAVSLKNVTNSRLSDCLIQPQDSQAALLAEDCSLLLQGNLIHGKLELVRTVLLKESP